MTRTLQTTQLSSLHPYEENAKKHPEKQIDQIARSIKAFGFNQPLVIDKDNIIVVGHGRYYAAQRLGLEEVPTIQINDLTSDEVDAYRLADNKLNESDWDMNLAIEQLKYLDSQGFDITLTGFDKDLLIESDEKDDQIPENAPTRAKLGDIWQLGRHRVMCGDSTQKEAILTLMGGIKADMVFTDPPYGVDYVSRVDEVRRKDWGGIKNDDLKGVELQEFLKKSVDWFDNTYIFCNWQSYVDFVLAFGKPKQLIVWNKGWVGLGKGYRNQHEFLLFYGVLNTTTETNLWDIKRDSEYKHPTQKPVALGQRAITNSLLPDRIVYDPFLGSGSTLIAAEKTGRVCYACEIDPKYVDVTLQRWEDFTQQKAVKING